ncbi:S8 family peptidase [Acinetobacter soli]
MHKYMLFIVSIGLGITSAHAQLSSEQARAKLSAQALQKVAQGKINLDALLNNASNDLIVETNHAQPLTSTSLITQLHQQKQNLRQRLSVLGGVQLMRDYNALPLTFYRIQQRDTLVKLLNDPEVKAVYPNIASKTMANENLNLIGQPAVKSKGYTGQGTSVAILDTGVDYRLNDFGNCTRAGTPASCRVSYAMDMAPEDNQLDDSEKHGTNVAAIAATVAADTKIIAMDVFRGKLAYDSDIAAALNWVTNNAKTLNIKTANMSLGGDLNTSTCTGSLSKSFQTLREAGVLPVVAAGNSAKSNAISYPACLQGAVSVGAVYDSNIGRVMYSSCTDSSSYADKVACFSNSSANLTLLAPGVRISGGGIVMSGTSQATPHVAAALAIIRANNAFANDSLDESVNRLKNSGTLVTDTRNGLRFSRLNLAGALSGLTGTPTQNNTATFDQNNSAAAPATPTKCTRTLFFTSCRG